MILAVRYLREMLAAARAQPAFTTVSASVVGVAVVAVMLTAGRAAAQEAAVLATFDDARPRVIVIHPTSADGRVTTALVDQLSQLPEVAEVAGFAHVYDVRASGLPHGNPVALREIYQGPAVGIAPATGRLGRVVATPAALSTLGLLAGSGSVSAPDRADALVAAVQPAPDYLGDREPLLLAPITATDAAGERLLLNEVVVLCRTTAAVGFVARISANLLADSNAPGDIAIETSSELAAIQSAVSGELSRQSHAILLGVLGCTTLAVLLSVCGLLFLRRKDLGRRRVLGASRASLVILCAGQVVVTAVGGVVLGIAIALAVGVARGDPLPGPDYVAALGCGILVITVVASVVPAAVAASRDPLGELRVP